MTVHGENGLSAKRIEGEMCTEHVKLKKRLNMAEMNVEEDQNKNVVGRKIFIFT